MTAPVRGSVALVTCAAHPELSPDDRLLLPVLAGAGFEPLALRWDEPDERWERHAAVVIRSCWDYHQRVTEFHAWLDRLEASGARALNPVPILRWNADKRYLRDLARAGIGGAHRVGGAARGRLAGLAGRCAGVAPRGRKAQRVGHGVRDLAHRIGSHC
jgi:hypothetical protein